LTRVLIVDDHEDNLYYLRAMLEGHGYAVDVARHGEEALSLARKIPPDLVISDLLMPVMDGYTLLSHWKSDERLRQAPFIVYTATYTDPQDEELALNLGADAFVLKPADPEDFLASLRRVESLRATSSPAKPVLVNRDSGDFLKAYSETLIRKLEEKSTQLERANFLLKQDLAARGAREAALRKSEAELRMLADAIPQIIWITDAAGMNTFISSRWEEYTGVPVSGGFGEGWIACFHPSEQSKVVDAWREAVQTGQEQSFECRLRRHDGTYRWWLVRSVPVRDETGVIVRWFGACTDIHDLKEAQVQLAEQATLLDKAHDAIFVTDMHRRILYWNAGAERLFGWRAHEAIGRAANELLGIEEGATQNALSVTIAENEWIGELTKRSRSGKSIVMDARWTLVRDDDGNPKSILAIETDITAQKVMDERMRRSQRLESIGQLTGGVAHDFNNLLTVILGSAETLVEQLADNSALRPIAQTAKLAAERGADLTFRLLAFARQQKLDPRTVAILPLLSEMLPLLRRTLGANVDIELRGQKDLWDAMIDAPQLESAVLNLCINARDAMPSGGGITIEVENVRLESGDAAAADIEEGDYVMLAVSDTGTGMAPETLTRALEPFFTTKEVGKGSGLGLSMVYGFARQSDGHLKIYSEIGHGTTVKLYLPRGRAQVETTSAVDVMETTTISGRILLVEDDDLVRQSVRRQLIGIGFEVIDARNGVEAMEILEQSLDFDLLFTDAVMPGGVDGYDLVKKAREKRPDLPIILTSGYTEAVMSSKGSPDNRFQLLSKPYSRKVLEAKIKAVMTGTPVVVPTVVE